MIRVIKQEDINKINFDEISKFYNYEDEKLLIFTLMDFLYDHFKYLTPSDIIKILIEKLRINIPRTSVQTILSNALKNNEVIRKKYKGKYYYTLMMPAIDLIKPRIISVNPENPYNNIREIKTFFSSLKGTIKICDPYIDSKSLDLLLQIEKQNNIKYLTVNINNPKVFDRDFKAFLKQQGNIEVRINKNNVLHDRFIIDDNFMVIIGHSLNQIGNKQSFIIEAGPDIRKQMIIFFDRQWNISSQHV